MRSTKQISPDQVYDLFPYHESPDDNTFFCMVIEEGGAHPYLRTGNKYQYIEDDEFTNILMKTCSGCLQVADIPYDACEIQFTLKINPYRLVDEVLVDRRTGQLYRKISWCWGHAMCGGSILVPLSANQVKELRKKA